MKDILSDQIERVKVFGRKTEVLLIPAFLKYQIK